MQSSNEELTSQSTPSNIFLLCTDSLDYIPDIRLKYNQSNAICIYIKCRDCAENSELKLEDYLKSMKELSSKSHQCTMKEEHSSSPSTTYCVICSDWLCEECIKVHTASTESNEHTLLSAEIIIPSQCQKHYINEYEAYCNDCKKSLCDECLIKHKSPLHDVITIESLQKELKENIGIKDVLNKLTAIRNKNKDYKNKYIALIEGQSNSSNSENNNVTELKEELINAYNENETINGMIYELIQAAVMNYEVLSNSPSLELMNNLKQMLNINHNEPKFDDTKQLADNCKHLIEYYKTNYIVKIYHKIETEEGDYDGEYLNNTKEGYGVLKYDSTVIYRGHWHNNMKNGKGILITPENIFDGNWLDDKENGFGQLFIDNELKYKGEWKNGERHGKGMMVYACKDKYYGDWVNGINEGEGVFISAKGDQYKGSFLNGRRHGKGICLYANGNIYDGEWANSNKEGYGVLKCANGDEYQGQWMKGKRHGKGKQVYGNGDEAYDGEWFNDVKENEYEVPIDDTIAALLSLYH